ncbi:sialic acid-binding Ig-like lectin 12 [Lampetra planeri]
MFTAICTICASLTGGGGLTGPLVSYGLAVRVREGDRALLPCAFCFPWSRISYKVQGSWLINDAFGETKTENIVYSSVSNTSPIEGYRGRVALVGSLSSGSCSLEIRDARKGDSRTYFFHANSDGTKFSGNAGITITAIPTRVALTPAPLELHATEPATLDCSVDAVFPMDSVTVRWILVDAVKWTNSTSQSRSPDGTFTVTSRLSFTPSAEDDGKKCRCEASGGDLVSTMVQEFILVVKYAPVVVNLTQDETCGGDLCILCEVKANPRATITWRTMESDASELIQTQDGNGTVTLSSLVMKRSQEQNVTCVAANEVGETEAVFYFKG